MDRDALAGAEPMALVALGRLAGAVGMLNPGVAGPMDLESSVELLRKEDAGVEGVAGRVLHATTFNVARLFLEERFREFEVNSLTVFDPFALDDLLMSIHVNNEANVQRVVAASVFDAVDAVSLPLVAPGNDVFLGKCLELTVTRRIRVLGQVARIYGHLADSGDVPAHLRNSLVESSRKTLGFLCASLTSAAGNDSPHPEHDRDDNTNTSDHQ